MVNASQTYVGPPKPEHSPGGANQYSRGRERENRVQETEARTCWPQRVSDPRGPSNGQSWSPPDVGKVRKPHFLLHGRKLGKDTSNQRPLSTLIFHTLRGPSLRARSQRCGGRRVGAEMVLLSYRSRVMTAPCPLFVPPTMRYAGAAIGVLERAVTASSNVASQPGGIVVSILSQSTRIERKLCSTLLEQSFTYEEARGGGAMHK